MNSEYSIDELKAEVIRLRIELTKVRKEVSIPKMKIRRCLTNAITELDKLINELNEIVI